MQRVGGNPAERVEGGALQPPFLVFDVGQNQVNVRGDELGRELRQRAQRAYHDLQNDSLRAALSNDVVLSELQQLPNLEPAALALAQSHGHGLATQSLAD